MTPRLIKILKEVLSEVGDLSKVEPYQFDDSSPLDYRFDLEDGTQVRVNFAPLSTVSRYGTFTALSKLYTDTQRDRRREYNVSFTVGGSQHQYQKSDLKSFNKLLKTVVECIKSFMQKNDPTALWIFGVDKKGKLAGDRQKNILYQALTKNNMPDGFRGSEATLSAPSAGYSGDVQGWVIFK